ncbi:nucleoside transporter C-terminal domain-containing protein [Aequorivita todarodis]|uniref:NupC/NupG family nucleoside CNT transporter n=1 Tax=Aequorivita todarodis TaxID=2036821 RepID=UPI002350EDD3|nr:nucleoside transporter C-terminal domain-containing protein [Aequorivita todarodis]MDC8001814.1 nucleoside transporter C-terminal domain-containing protein [Aequorivita todarodis]
MQKFILVAFTLFFFGNLLGQSIEKTWQFSEMKDENGLAVLNINPEKDYLKLHNGAFEYQLAPIDSLKSSGDYIFQNNLLVLFFNNPKDGIRRFRVEQLTDSTLSLSENNYKYQLKTPNPQHVSALETVAKSSEIIPSQGFSAQSFWRGILGMVSLLVIAFLFSSNRKAIRWKTVGIGLAFQLLIAIGVLKVGFIKNGFEAVGQLFVNVLEYTRAGSEFLFGGMLDINSFGFIFAFQVLPTIIFFSALTSVLFYFGIIQVVVKGMGWLLTKLLNISGAESLSVAGNIFLGQTEAPLLIKAYLEKMNKSEMLLVMIGGMATVAGAVLAAYIGFLGGDDPALRLTFAKHLLAASVMAAPGAIVISKILYPQTEPINTDVKVSSEKIGSNFLDAIANGTTEGLKLAVNVGAMLLVFVAFIAMFNGILGALASFDGFTIEALNIHWHFMSLNELIAEKTAYDGLSLEFILGTILAPLMWLMGVAKEDMTMMGQLLGIKLVASEFVGYIQLADLKNVQNELHLNYEKSIIMATYMLCGFANFASIGIQIGGIGSLAPGQRKTLSKFGMKALIGGTIASLISATIAGMIIG